MECIGYKPEWMLGCIKLRFIRLGNHNIKQICPGVTTVQRILIKKKKKKKRKKKKKKKNKKKKEKKKKKKKKKKTLKSKLKEIMT